MKTRTIINGVTVGNGRWKFQSILNYCKRKNIELSSAYYQTYSMRYGFDKEYLDVNNGKVQTTTNNDPYSAMLGM